MRESVKVKIPKIVKKNRYNANNEPKKNVYLRMDYNLFLKLNKKASDTGMSLNRIVQDVIREYL